MRSTFRPHLVNGFFGDPALYVRIAHQGRALLFDCGELYDLTPRELLKIEAVFVSHSHIDHLIGFDRLLRAFLYLDRHLKLYGPPGLIDQIQNRLAGYTWNLVEERPFVVTVREWCDGEIRECSFAAADRFKPGRMRRWQCGDNRIVSSRDWEVRVASLAHGNIASMAFSLEETLHVAVHKDALNARHYRPGPWLTEFKGMVRSGQADDTTIEVPLLEKGTRSVTLGALRRAIAHCERGMKLAYVADASPTEENFRKIVELADDAHMLVIEAAFSHDDHERARARNHLTAHLAGRLARAAGAAKLLVYHHSPRYQNTPGRLWGEAMDAFEGKEA